MIFKSHLEENCSEIVVLKKFERIFLTFSSDLKYVAVEKLASMGDLPLLKMEQINIPSENMSDWGETAPEDCISGAT